MNTQQLQRDNLPKRWAKEQSEEWQTIWSGLTTNAQRTPVLDLTRDAVRVTRGLTTATSGGVREFVLVQAKADVARVISSVEKDESFERRTISGLAVWLRPDFALARVGQRTLAVGLPPEVEELVQVRLGIKQDLKITGNFFERFQELDQGTTIRLISNDPPSLDRYFSPIFTPELLEATQILGLGLTLDNPVKARLILRLKSAKAAEELAQQMRENPQRWLRLHGFRAASFRPAPGDHRAGRRPGNPLQRARE